MRSLNITRTIGHIGKKPELKKTPNGTAYSRFSVACNYKFMSNGEPVEGVNWVSFIAWAKLAEIVAKHLDKGSLVCVEGRVTTNQWEDKKSKKTQYRTQLVATDVLFLDPKGENVSPEPVSEQPASEVITEEDVPF